MIEFIQWCLGLCNDFGLHEWGKWKNVSYSDLEQERSCNVCGLTKTKWK